MKGSQMSNNSKSTTPHWIMRLLGAKAATFSLVDNGLSVSAEPGEHYVVLTDSLAAGVDCVDGFFFSKLVLKTDKGTMKFCGLRKKDALMFFANMLALAVQSVSFLFFYTIFAVLKWGLYLMLSLIAVAMLQRRRRC